MFLEGCFLVGPSSGALVGLQLRSAFKPVSRAVSNVDHQTDQGVVRGSRELRSGPDQTRPLVFFLSPPRDVAVWQNYWAPHSSHWLAQATKHTSLRPWSTNRTASTPLVTDQLKFQHARVARPETHSRSMAILNQTFWHKKLKKDQIVV